MGGGVVWGEVMGAGVWCVRMRWSDPVGMQPRGEGRGDEGGELACFGPEAGR